MEVGSNFPDLLGVLGVKSWKKRGSFVTLRLKNWRDMLPRFEAGLDQATYVGNALAAGWTNKRWLS